MQRSPHDAQRLPPPATPLRCHEARRAAARLRALPGTIVTVFGDAATLKGCFALELRIKEARATKDVDLRVMGSAQELLAKLQAAGRLDLGDFMTFEVAPDAEHPELLNELEVRWDALPCGRQARR